MISHTTARDALRILSEAANCIGRYGNRHQTLLDYIEQQEAESHRNLKTRYFVGDIWTGITASRRIAAIAPDRYTMTYERHGKPHTITMTSWSTWVTTTKAVKLDEVFA